MGKKKLYNKGTKKIINKNNKRNVSNVSSYTIQGGILGEDVIFGVHNDFAMSKLNLENKSTAPKAKGKKTNLLANKQSGGNVSIEKNKRQNSNNNSNNNNNLANEPMKLKNTNKKTKTWLTENSEYKDCNTKSIDNAIVNIFDKCTIL